MKDMTISGLTVTLIDMGAGHAPPDTVVYTHLDGDGAREAAALVPPCRAVLAAVDGVDWDDALSPWKAPRAFRGGQDFSGGADAHIALMTGGVMPAVENALGFVPVRRMIAGYSLAGLFAVYALYKTGAFTGVASVSGSLWYDGFVEYMGNAPLALPARDIIAYFSLGDRESAARNPRLAAVGRCTQEAERLLKQKGASTLFELNPGGHFDDSAQRLARGVAFLTNSMSNGSPAGALPEAGPQLP